MATRLKFVKLVDEEDGHLWIQDYFTNNEKNQILKDAGESVRISSSDISLEDYIEWLYMDAEGGNHHGMVDVYHDLLEVLRKYCSHKQLLDIFREIAETGGLG